MGNLIDNIKEAAAFLEEQLNRKPKIGLILGSGLVISPTT